MAIHETFKRLAHVIVKLGEKVEVDDPEMALFVNGDLKITFDTSGKKPKATLILFEAFGGAHVMEPDGSLMTIDIDESDEENFYAINDLDFKKALYDFIQWRIKVAHTYQI